MFTQLLTQQNFSAPLLKNFHNKGNGLYTMAIQLATAGPKKGTASMQVCAPRYLCKTQTVDAPDPGTIFTFELPESQPLETKFFAIDGANVRLENGNSTVSDSITFFAQTSGGQPPYRYIYFFDAQISPVTSSPQASFGSIVQGTHIVSITTLDANNQQAFTEPDLFEWTVVAQ